MRAEFNTCAGPAGLYIDPEQKFRTILDDEVVEL